MRKSDIPAVIRAGAQAAANRHGTVVHVDSMSEVPPPASMSDLDPGIVMRAAIRSNERNAEEEMRTTKALGGAAARHTPHAS